MSTPLKNAVRPASTTPVVSAQAPHLDPSTPAWRPHLGSGRTTAGLLLVYALVAAAAFAAVIGMFVAHYGTGAVLVATAVGLVPLAILIVAANWMDRWEPEPRVTRWFAFLWGGGVAVLLALLVDKSVTALAAVTDPSVLVIAEAPVVEESAKGLGVLLIALIGRRYIDGPVDGVVYAAMVAVGFTFSEDVLYFAGAFHAGGAADLVNVGVIRGLLSPFAHTMFTACIGMAVGYAVRRPGKTRVVLAWLAGLMPAIALHALWNFGAVRSSNFIAFYIVVQVPLFAVAVGISLLLRRNERRRTRDRLMQYAKAGWFNRAEIEWLASVRGRDRALRWARRFAGSDKAVLEAMRQFIRAATQLAALREQLENGRGGEVQRDGVSPVDEEQRLLALATASRAVLAGARREPAGAIAGTARVAT